MGGNANATGGTLWPCPGDTRVLVLTVLHVGFYIEACSYLQSMLFVLGTKKCSVSWK